MSRRLRNRRSSPSRRPAPAGKSGSGRSRATSNQARGRPSQSGRQWQLGGFPRARHNIAVRGDRKIQIAGHFSKNAQGDCAAHLWKFRCTRIFARRSRRHVTSGRGERPEYWRAGWLTARLIQPSLNGLSIGGRSEKTIFKSTFSILFCLDMAYQTASGTWFGHACETFVTKARSSEFRGTGKHEGNGPSAQKADRSAPDHLKERRARAWRNAIHLGGFLEVAPECTGNAEAPQAEAAP